MNTRYAYYPGCSLHSTGSEYDVSFKAVCDKLGIGIQEIKGWICCGTSPAHCTSRLLSLALPYENLCLAEKMGMTDVVAPCAACFARLRTAIHEANEDPEIAGQISEALGKPLPKSVNVLSPLEIFSNGSGLEAAVARQLPELKVVCYYGCLLTRPSKVMQFDECEYPMAMDELLRSVGITTLEWSYKTDCCGGALAMTRTDVVLKLTRDIFEEAKTVGANAIAVGCPLCHVNLDTRQEEVEQEYDVQYGLPIFYFTQLMGLALGVPTDKLGLHKHFVSTDELLRSSSKGQLAAG
ncbi:MAG: CoB--CoM heterodisulfide reductase iron-sulfur subunit B family protein [Phycisphaerales bacterium]|nr:MAG: CoB--CoM heterodisulfide reductase iron-sulfur subunit B family protein [Phycisphaerales bacterium]